MGKDDHLDPEQGYVTEADLYVNFLLHAIFGKLSEADAIVRFGGDQIRAVADQLTSKLPFEPKPLHRGLLLDPTESYRALDQLTFLSWSEDRRVAEWFACPRSAVSEPLMKHNPKLRGHIIQIPAPRSRVLFHHSWARMFDGLATIALGHPFMGEEGQRQIEWSLRTQREVITEPVEDLSPQAASELDSTALANLERRLSPPWIIAKEGIRS